MACDNAELFVLHSGCAFRADNANDRNVNAPENLHVRLDDCDVQKGRQINLYYNTPDKRLPLCQGLIFTCFLRFDLPRVTPESA